MSTPSLPSGEGRQLCSGVQGGEAAPAQRERRRLPRRRRDCACAGAQWSGQAGRVGAQLCVPLCPQLFLPSMRKKPALADGSSPEGDLLQEHWLVDDMFIFENVGFTKDVGNVKFLVCADCEIGPIGWHCLDDKKSFYVALERVSHE
nr:guanine nucleotide exchange factor MSS4 [Vicugna pacos]